MKWAPLVALAALVAVLFFKRSAVAGALTPASTTAGTVAQPSRVTSAPDLYAGDTPTSGTSAGFVGPLLPPGWEPAPVSFSDTMAATGGAGPW